MDTIQGIRSPSTRHENRANATPSPPAVGDAGFALRGSRSGVLPGWPGRVGGPVCRCSASAASWRWRRAACPGPRSSDCWGVTVAGLVLGVSEWQGIASLPPDPTSTLLALDMAGALQGGHGRLDRHGGAGRCSAPRR